MKLYEILDSGRRILEGNGVPNPDIDAELLWQYVSGMNKLDIIMNRGEDIPSDIADRYMRAISERRSRIPLQYRISWDMILIHRRMCLYLEWTQRHLWRLL